MKVSIKNDQIILIADSDKDERILRHYDALRRNFSSRIETTYIHPRDDDHGEFWFDIVQTGQEDNHVDLGPGDYGTKI